MVATSVTTPSRFVRFSASPTKNDTAPLAGDPRRVPDADPVPRLRRGPIAGRAAVRQSWRTPFDVATKTISSPSGESAASSGSAPAPKAAPSGGGCSRRTAGGAEEAADAARRPSRQARSAAAAAQTAAAIFHFRRR